MQFAIGNDTTAPCNRKITLLQLAQGCFHPARQPVVGGCCALHLGFAKASSVFGLYSVPFTVCYNSWMVLKSTVCWSSSFSLHIWLHVVVSILHIGRGQALFTGTVTEVGGGHWISDLPRDWPRVYFWMCPHLWAGKPGKVRSKF